MKRKRQKQDPRDALIWAGTEMCSERGFHLTRVDELLKRVGVPKGSFYHYFRDKEEFGEAVIDNYAKYFEHKIDRYLSDSSLPPLKRFQELTRELISGMARYAFRRGCLVGNLGQELGGLHDAFRVRLELILEDWQTRTANCFREAIARGDLPSDADAERLAEFFWIGWEGAILRAKLSQSAFPLTNFVELFFDRFLMSAIVRPESTNA